MSDPTPMNCGSASLGPTADWERRSEDSTDPRASHAPTVGRSVPDADGAALLPQAPGYEVLNELGQGGMGVVYRARQISLNRIVALKMVRSDTADGRDLARFRAEAETLAHLGHPNIVQVFEVGEHEGRPFFAMEYLQGGSLSRRLGASALPAEEAAPLVETLARAVHAAHQRGVVHRDLKPGNVLLSADGTPKISDFGLAKRLEGGIEQTQTGAVVGTPAYMSPEQAAGRSHAIGPSTDIYALGAVLYRLLTGQPPFHGSDPTDVLIQVRTADPLPPRQRKPAVPRDLETICLKCLSKEPRQRYASAEELADDLARFLRREPIQARRAGPVERLALWVVRRPALAAASGLLVLVAALLALGTSVTWLWARAEAARGDAETARDELAHQQEETDAARRRAEQAETHARQAEETAKQLHYLRSVSAALGHWRDNELTAALTVLDECEPSRRGWEWRYVRGLCRSQLWAHQAPAPFLGSCFSPDGKRLAADSGGVVRVWDVDTGKVVLTLTGHAPPAFQMAPSDVRFSPDGRLLAAPGRDNTVRVWDAHTGKAAFALKGHNQVVHAVAFSPDSRRIATGGRDGTVRLWDARTGKVEQSLKVFGAALGVSFSPDGRRIAAGSSDRAVHVWDLDTSREVFALKGHTEEITGVSYGPDGKHLAGSSFDGAVRVWNLATGQEVCPPLHHRQAVLGISFSPDGRQLTSAGLDKVVRLWDVRTGREVVSLKGHVGGISSVCFSPDGRRLASAGLDRRLHLWDARAGRESMALKVVRLPPAPLPAFANPVTGIGFLRDGREVVGVSLNGTVRAWDAASGREVQSVVTAPTSLVASCFSPDGGLLAAGAGNVVRVWETRTAKDVSQLVGHTGPVHRLAFSPDGRQLASASEDKTARLWDARTGRELFVLKGHTATVGGACFSSDGKRLVTASQDRTVRLWDVSSGQALGSFDTGPDIPGFVCFRPDGEQLAVQVGHAVLLMDARTGRRLLDLRGHTAMVCEAAFSPDGGRLATLGEDNALRLWDARSGLEILTLRVDGKRPFSRVQFSPDGCRLAAGSSDGAVHVWDAPLSALK